MTQNLWAPWRMSYIQGLSDGGKPADPPGCFLCEAAQAEPDSNEFAQRLMLLRDQRGMVLLNRYPYTSGHLLVAPARHVPGLADLTAEERVGLMELAALAERVVEFAYNPQGLNIGMNLGRCAGAGLPGHLHMHLVPRWNGDTNFMTVVGDVRIVPQALERSYQQLRDALCQVAETGQPGTPEAPATTETPAAP